MMKRWLVAMSAMAQFACDCCIARGAKVKTPRGEVNVEDVAVGDEVIVVDPETLEQHVGRVTHVRTAKRECGRLDQLRLTSSHPLYDPEKHEWAPAGDWLLGVRSVLQTVDGPRHVSDTERFVGVDDVFDLTVDHPLHTFVADGVVVHNKPPLTLMCVDRAGQTLAHGYACRCGDESGRAMCPSEDSIGWCDCGAGNFSSDWRTEYGVAPRAVTDGEKWLLLPCDGDAGLEVVAQPAAVTTGNALRVSPSACGRVDLTTDADALRAGEVWVRVDGVVSRPMPFLTVDHVVVFGLAPDADGGVRFFTGSVHEPAIATASLEMNRWHLMSWAYDVGNGVRVYPRVGHGPSPLTGLHFAAPDGGASLFNWYTAADGGFPASFAPTRLRLGVTEPSEVELHFAGFELKPR